MAKPEIIFNPGENLIHEGSMSRILSRMNIQGGSAYLTNERFLRFKQSTGLQILIGLLAFLFKDKPDFEVALGEIKGLARGKQGLNKNVILMTLNDGSEYKLICTKFDQWMERFGEAYLANGRFTLTALSEEQWAVQPATRPR